MAMLHLAPFKGRMSYLNPHSMPEGSTQTQSNLCCLRPGQLDVRPGCRLVSFANAGSQVSSDVIAMTSFIHPTGRFVVMQLADGKIRAGRSPT